MEKIAEQIRSEASRLLEKGEVELVVGFRKGSIPMVSRPWLARTPPGGQGASLGRLL